MLGRNDLLLAIEDTIWRRIKAKKAYSPTRTPSAGAVGLMRRMQGCEAQAGIQGNAAVTRMTLAVVEV
jgi:alpha-D-ribose 1-methylphosphonate 5-triphosphate synthase subunit PhnG